MQANIKFKRRARDPGLRRRPVKLAVAEVQPDLAFRATAKVVGEVPAGAGLEALLNVHGEGRCAITLDPKDKLPGQQPYQGVVPLHGDRREPLQQVSQVLEHYMLQSEQLDTRLVLAANDEIAAGLLIQRLPLAGTGNLAGSPWKSGDEDGIGLSEGFNRIACSLPPSPGTSCSRCRRAGAGTAVLAREGHRLRATGAALCVHLLQRTRARHAAQPRPRRE